MAVIWPIFRAGFDSLPYICRDADGIAAAFFINSSWAPFEAPPRILSMMVAGNIAGIFVIGGKMPRMERS